MTSGQGYLPSQWQRVLFRIPTAEALHTRFIRCVVKIDLIGRSFRTVAFDDGDDGLDVFERGDEREVGCVVYVADSGAVDGSGLGF